MSGAFELIFKMICEDPQSGSCPNTSYADYHGPVANPNLTTSPYAYQCDANSPAAGLMPMSSKLGGLRTGDSTVDTLKSALRNAGNSVQATEEIAAAMCTLAQYGLLGFGSGYGMHGFGMGGVGASSGSVGGLSLQYLTGILSGETNVNISMVGGGAGGGGGFNKRNTGGNRSFDMNSSNNGSSFNFGGGRGNGSEASSFMGGDNSFGGVGGGSGMSFPGATSTYGGALPASVAGGGESVMEEVQVSEAFVGAVLGHGGKAIVEIQRMTGATIQVSKKGVYAEGTRNRVVTITGVRSSVDRALHNIRECISQEEDKRVRQDRMKL